LLFTINLIIINGSGTLFSHMLKTVRKTIENSSMLTQGDHLVVAVSGGPDSVALLWALILLSSEYRLRLTTAHLNHGLRGIEAKEEEDFVHRISNAMGITCICKTVDIRLLRSGRGQSLEEIGREERYRFLNDAADRCGAWKIATGHHRDDQAETVLINLIRGSGLLGLKGILPVRDNRIIRPLLDVSREEILEFLNREGLSYRVDSSNLDPIYLRNRIRRYLIPDLKAGYNPRIVPSLCHMAKIVHREDDYLQNVVHQILHEWGIIPGAEDVRLPISSLLGLHEAIQGRIIKCLLEAAVPPGKGIGFRHIETVLTLLRPPYHNRKTSLDLPCLICVEKEEATLRIRRTGPRQTRRERLTDTILPTDYSYSVEIPGAVYIPAIDRHVHIEFVDNPGLLAMRSTPRVAFLDYARISPPLVLRNVKPGDRIEPLGMGETKKIKSYFIDRKISRECRRRTPLLVDSRSIIWIAGEMISDRVKVTEQTKTVLRAEMV
jgi:tRNA(Ile)-lysidine synthase